MQGLQSKVCLCQVVEAFLPKQSRGGQDLKTPRLCTDPMQQAGGPGASPQVGAAGGWGGQRCHTHGRS